MIAQGMLAKQKGAQLSKRLTEILEVLGCILRLHLRIVLVTMAGARRIDHTIHDLSHLKLLLHRPDLARNCVDQKSHNRSHQPAQAINVGRSFWNILIARYFSQSSQIWGNATDKCHESTNIEAVEEAVDIRMLVQ